MLGLKRAWFIKATPCQGLSITGNQLKFKIIVLCGKSPVLDMLPEIRMRCTMRMHAHFVE